MNIAFLTPAFDPRQLEASVITLTSLAEYLRDQGHTVIIIQNRERGLTHTEMTQAGIQIIRPYSFFKFAIGSGYNPLHFFDLVIAHALGVRWAERHQNIRFDVLHSFSAAPLLMYRAVLAKMLLRRRISLIHSFKSISQYRLGAYFPRRVARFFDAITVQTEFQRDYLERKGVAPKRIQIIPSHINTKKFKPRDKKSLKQLHGFADRFVILYYGHFLEVKGVEYLIRAIPALMKRTKKSFRVLLAWSGLGDFRTYDRLLAETQTHGIITVLKHADPIEEYVSMADVVVLPYPHLLATEANPSCILESMASKTLVITSDLQELPLFLKAGHNLLKVSPRDSVALSVTLADVIEEAVDIKPIINQAYIESAQFDLDQIGKRYISLYEQATE
ncbi:MAG: glycosyltransferase family 4 protein [Candidatus Kerfeldbacteria bacterium]|nr:glycosyltransferase family 4 protein [Candidatus Kerfeldbacteria bacterium]